MFPAADPAPAPARFPAFIAVWLTLRVKFPAPPAWIIHPVTVGIVKYLTIPMIIKLIYTVFEVSGIMVGSDNICMSSYYINYRFLVCIEINRQTNTVVSHTNVY